MRFLSLILVTFLLFSFGCTLPEEPTQKETVPTEETQPTIEKTPAPPPQKQWITVIDFSGNANKRSDIFELTGGKAKLIHNVSGNMVLVGIYIFPEGWSRETQGGFAETTVNEAGSDTTFLVKKAGRYYLDIISANANWSIKIEEER